MKATTRLGITLGDPSGIGPEIVAVALATMPAEWRRRVTVYGAVAPLTRGAKAMGVTATGNSKKIAEHKAAELFLIAQKVWKESSR